MEPSSGVADAVIEDLERFALASISHNDSVLDEEGHVDGRKVFAAYVRSFALLDRLEERRLARVIAEGGPDADGARECFVCSNLGLVRKVANDFEFRGRARRTGYLDLVREGVLALGDAVNGFDPDYGAKFSSYAVPTIRRRLKKYLGSPERKAEDAKKRAFAHPDLAPAVGAGLDEGRLDVVGSAGRHLSQPKLGQPGLGEDLFDEAEDRKQAKRGDGMDVRTIHEVGVGGLKRRVTVVDSEDDVRARFREARIGGSKQPTFVCSLCGETVRKSDEASALKWFREHPHPEAEPEGVRIDYLGRPHPYAFSGDSATGDWGRRLNVKQALTVADRLDRLREESRYWHEQAEQGKKAAYQWLSRGGKRAT